MFVAGILLIALAVVAFPIAFLTALLGFGEVATVSFAFAKLAWLLVVPGVVLLALGARAQDETLAT